ncbi:MAG TPA: pilus assembly protein TadG-related protein [Planctomycetaceae bacterium]|nr:pilus assembly protein TadG-related protein [Planctomycetaceae bacterium]
MNTHHLSNPPATEFAARRRGMVLVLATAALIMILGFAAFSIDIGYIALTRTQLQGGADAAAMAAVQELPPGLTFGAWLTPGEVAVNARTVAVDIAGRHKAGDRLSAYCDGERDVRFGQVTWDPVAGTWQKVWGVSPYNAVEVTLRRDQAAGGGDGPLPLFFSPVIGHRDAKLSVKAVAAILPANGFYIPPGGGNAGILPFTLDEETWDNLINFNIGEGDLFHYNPETGAVTSGSDGIQEINLYPAGNKDLPPGNRGTVDIGAENNSTSDLERQIVYGLNEFDLNALGFPLNFDNGPLTMQGDTGLSLGFKDALESVKGQSKALPIFRGMPVGNGNNAEYTIVKFVGVRIVEVKLNGNPKRVMIQPAPHVDPAATKDTTGTSVEDATMFTTATLIQ